MSETLSLFGAAFEPADPPTADRCPACGGPAKRGAVGPCARCTRAGVVADRLDLAAVPTVTGGCGPLPAGTAPCLDCGKPTASTDPQTCSGCRAAASVAARRVDVRHVADETPTEPDLDAQGRFRCSGTGSHKAHANLPACPWYPATGAIH